MAYISQYEIDMREDAKRNDLFRGIGQIGAAFQENANRRRALDEKRKMEDLAFAKEGIGQDQVVAFRESGDTSGIAKLYAERKAKELEKKANQEELDNRYKLSQIKANEAAAADKSAPWEQSREGQAYQAKLNLESEQNQNKLAAQKAADAPALEVPGFGLVRTKEEASNIRKAKADADEAKAIIAQIKELGTNIGPLDRERQGKISQLKTVLAGKMRLPLLGPGTMTESEYQRLIDNMGDPSSYFGSESNEKAKLEQLSGILDNSVKSYYEAAAANPSQPQQPMQSQAIPAPQVAPEIQQKAKATVQTLTPQQKEQLKQQLKAKKAGLAMGGN
jgi:hypothetical protein